MRRLLAAVVLWGGVPCARAADALPDGKAIYARRCAGCHGEDGKGQTKPGKKYKIANLADPSWPLAWSPERVHKVIVDGVPGQMPAWGAKLSAAEIDAVARYVLALAATK